MYIYIYIYIYILDAVEYVLSFDYKEHALLIHLSFGSMLAEVFLRRMVVA